MKHCIQFPEDRFLAVRPCLVAICFGNRPAAKLLGTLLYRYNLRAENKEDAENQNAVKAANGEVADQDITYRIFRKQAQLVDDMCGEITEKTLHDVAVPMLQVLGYLDLEEYMQSNCYILNIEQIQQALHLYKPTSKDHPQLEKFLISHMQLEKFLIASDELEKFLIDKKNFLSGLEKVLIYNRNISHCKRGRKPRPAQDLEGSPEDPKNLKELSEKDTEEESDSEQTNTEPFASSLSFDASLSQDVNDYHSQNLPIASSPMTTRNPQEGEPDDHDHHISQSHPGSASRNSLACAPGQYETQSQQRVAPNDRREKESTRQDVALEGEPDDHAQSLPSLPAASSLDRGSSHVPFGHSQVDSPGAPGASDVSDVPTPTGSGTDRGQNQTEEDWGRGSASGDTDVRGSITQRQVIPESSTQDRDNTSVEDYGPSPAPVPQVLPGVFSPPVHVLIVAQHFTDAEQWKEAHDAFIETLRGIWKQASSDFKHTHGNWNKYRKQYLDRWKKVNPEPRDDGIQFTPPGKALFDEWCSLFKVTVEAGKATVEAANWLAEPCSTWATLLNVSRVEVLRNEKDWLYANDKRGYYNRGVKLFDLKREFEGWQSYQQSLIDRAEREKARPANKYGTVSGLPHFEAPPEWREAMGGR